MSVNYTTDTAISNKLPGSPPWSQCTGVSNPPEEVTKPCYKCINDNAVQIKNDNAKEVEQKMRERTGAGNDSYMTSLAAGDNFDEDGNFICNKPKDFVNIDMLDKNPWKSDAIFRRVGKMRNSSGNIVDRPDITVEQKTLQYESAYCIAQRNASLAPHDVGSLNMAYSGMTARETVLNMPAPPDFEQTLSVESKKKLAYLALKSPTSTVGSSGPFSASSAFSRAATDDGTPLTATFSDVSDIKDAGDNAPVGSTVAN